MPPKLKKQPKNSCYFYMQERKTQLESRGHRFPGGIKDVFTSCGPEWSSMTKEDKAKYEEMAKKHKEEEKNNLHNKFTASGESYYQVNDRMRMERESAEKREKLVSDLVSNGNPKERMFILIKTLHSVEEVLTVGKMCWPSEIALIAFTLQGGVQRYLWKMVDTQKVPIGYASAAKDSSEECGIPMPGSEEEFSEADKDYSKILGDIQSFIESALEDYADYEDNVVFCKSGEIEPAKDALQWLFQHILENNEDKEDKRKFLEKLQFCELAQLMIKLALYGKNINPGHQSQLAQLQLVHTANAILDIGSYDYRSEITCEHHLKGEASQKMNFCCKNVVYRRVFLIFREFLPQYDLKELKRHNIDCLPKPTPKPIAVKRQASQSSSSAKYSPPRSSSNAWGSKKSSTSEYKDDCWSNASSKEDVFPDIASSTGAQAAYSAPWGNQARGNQAQPKENELNLTDDNFPTLESPFGRGVRRFKEEEQEDDFEGNPWVVGRGKAIRK